MARQLISAAPLSAARPKILHFCSERHDFSHPILCITPPPNHQPLKRCKPHVAERCHFHGSSFCIRPGLADCLTRLAPSRSARFNFLSYLPKINGTASRLGVQVVGMFSRMCIDCQIVTVCTCCNFTGVYESEKLIFYHV